MAVTRQVLRSARSARLPSQNSAYRRPKPVPPEYERRKRRSSSYQAPMTPSFSLASRGSQRSSGRNSDSMWKVLSKGPGTLSAAMRRPRASLLPLTRPGSSLSPSSAPLIAPRTMALFPPTTFDVTRRACRGRHAEGWTSISTPRCWRSTRRQPWRDPSQRDHARPPRHRFLKRFRRPSCVLSRLPRRSASSLPGRRGEFAGFLPPGGSRSKPFR